MSFYVGIDVSKKKIDCLWLRDPQTLKVKSKVFPNQQSGFEQLLTWMEKTLSPQAEQIHVIMEATGVYHEALAHALFDHGIRVSIVNPAFVHDFAKGLGLRNKTDQQDAKLLARYGAMTSPALWQPAAPEIRELKALLSRLDAVEKDLRRERNREEKALVSASSEAVLQSIRTIVEQLKQEVERLRETIDDHINRHPELKADRELLESIPAIGQVMSREMIGLLRSRQFTSASQAAAFVGLVPRQCESGQWRGQTRMSKNGNSRLRAKLYLAAVVATRYNPDIQAQYHRLLKAGKSKMQALGAAMRKLLQICFGVLKHHNKYQPQTLIRSACD